MIEGPNRYSRQSKISENTNDLDGYMCSCQVFYL